MKAFQENRCRMCVKVLCCKKCRLKHEETIHNVKTDCDICIYGKIYIQGASGSLLNHIRNEHLPLHCVFCKKLFNSLDEVVTHQKCTMEHKENSSNSKIPGTPVTPNLTSEPSPILTPFLKNLTPGNHLIGVTITMGITSTPMQVRDLSGKADKTIITPTDQSEIKYVYKSSLKLTGSSSNLNESKKSDRRVTFSETPMTEVYRKQNYFPKIDKYFPQNSQNISRIKRDMDEKNSLVNNSITEDDDDLYVSTNEMFVTAPVSPFNNTNSDNKETTNMALVPYIKRPQTDSESTIWETALTNNVSNSNIISPKENEVEEKINTVDDLSVNEKIEIAEENSLTEKLELHDHDISSDISMKVGDSSRSSNVWSSMTRIVKSVVQNMSFSNNVSVKRSRPDTVSDDSLTEMPRFKKMKLTDIKCRRPIRKIGPLYQIRMIRPRYVDKATQTDDIVL